MLILLFLLLNSNTMKKTILLIGALALTFSASAQVIESENFAGLTVGNVGTVFDASAPGQGNFLTFANNGDPATSTSTNAGNSNFQIVSSRGVNAFNLTTPDAVGGIRFMWKDGGLGTQWASRTAGNDVIEVEYTFNTGAITTSRGNVGMRLFSAAGNAIVGYGYSADTRELTGVAYLNNGGTPGTFNITLATGGLILTANTSYTIGCSYNTTTGEVLWKTDPAATGSSGLGAAFWIASQVPDELDFLSFANIANTAATPPTLDNASAATITFEGYSAEAVAVSNLLSTDEESLNDVSVKLFPNPASDILNITSNVEQFNAVSIVDLNGRLIKSFEVNSNEVNANIQDLKPGLYIVNISNDENTVSKKFIKE